MSRSIEELDSAWRVALDQEDVQAVETLVREILTEHALTALACEIRYHRGVSILTEGEGYGNQRLALALGEFEEGVKAGVKVGDEAEPWRSLVRTQLGACLARLGNEQDAATEFKAVSEVRPRSVMGLGALALWSTMVGKSNPREAKRVNSMKISYARALVRENKESEEFHYFQFLLAQELLDSEYAKEGLKLLDELGTLTEEALGEELFGVLQEQLSSFAES